MRHDHNWLKRQTAAGKRLAERLIKIKDKLNIVTNSKDAEEIDEIHLRYLETVVKDLESIIKRYNPS